MGLLALTCAMPSAASAATLNVPADFASIQAAVDAAAPGDTVAVRARDRSYLESVEVSTPGITILGVQGRPVVDGFDLSTSDATVQVQADGVQVRNLAIRNEDGYDCDANGCVVRDVSFRGFFSSDCVEIDGDNARVLGTNMVNCGNQGIDVNGANARVLRNTIDGIDADCINVNGPSPDVVGNRVSRCEDDQGIEVDNGDEALVEGNVVRRTDSGGVFVEGDDVLVRENDVGVMDSRCYELSGDGGAFDGNIGTDCDGGLQATGVRWKIRENQFADVHDSACIRVQNRQGLVAENLIDDCYKGIELQSEGVVRDNQISDVFADDGIGINCSDEFNDPDPPDPAACDGVRVTGNVVAGAGDDDSGISVFIEFGTGTAIIKDNTVRDTFDDGIEAFMSNGLVQGNVVTRAGAEEEEGIDVFGGGNVIQDNVSTRNGGDGILVRTNNDGDGGNVIANNTVEQNDQDGIRTLGVGDLVSGNVATANNGDGIEIDGTIVDVIDNLASGNRIDCATDGSVDENEGNDCADGSNFILTSSGLPS